GKAPDDPSTPLEVCTAQEQGLPEGTSLGRASPRFESGDRQHRTQQGGKHGYFKDNGVCEHNCNQRDNSLRNGSDSRYDKDLPDDNNGMDAESHNIAEEEEDREGPYEGLMIQSLSQHRKATDSDTCHTNGRVEDSPIA
ncbi:unnamed protein product, partial [Prorocentrum cordatum]